MMPMPVSMHCAALCGINRAFPLHWKVLATTTLAMGNGKVAKGKVTKLAKKDMYVKGNEHKLKTKTIHVTVHVMNKVKKSSGHACVQW